MTLPEDPRDLRLKRRVDIVGLGTALLGVAVLPSVLPRVFAQEGVGLAFIWGITIGAILLFLGLALFWSIDLRGYLEQESAYTMNVLAWVRAASDEELDRLPEVLPSHRDLKAFVRIEREERARSGRRP